MTPHYTHYQLATNFALWGEYFDGDATMTEAEFDALTVQQRMALLADAYGTDAAVHDGGDFWNVELKKRPACLALTPATCGSTLSRHSTPPLIGPEKPAGFFCA